MLKAKDFERFEKIVSPEFRGVYSDEMTRKSKEMADMRAADFKSYELGKMDVVFVTPDAALICYRATVVSTKNGKDVSNMINAATLWKRQGNAWSVASMFSLAEAGPLTQLRAPPPRSSGPCGQTTQPNGAATLAHFRQSSPGFPPRPWRYMTTGRVPRPWAR
jgi:hypothetical protein